MSTVVLPPLLQRVLPGRRHPVVPRQNLLRGQRDQRRGKRAAGAVPCCPALCHAVLRQPQGGTALPPRTTPMTMSAHAQQSTRACTQTSTQRGPAPSDRVVPLR